MSVPRPRYSLTYWRTKAISHMIGRRYTLDDAKIAAARAAHLAAVIRSGSAPQDLSTIRFEDIAVESIKDQTLAARFEVLNRLKRFNSEAFYHWLRVRDSVVK